MKLKHLAAATGLALATGTASAAPWVTVDARSGGMGGLSVVTSNIDAAPFTNPAMLAAGQRDDDFGLLLTGGVTIGDPQDLSGSIGDFQSTFTQLTNEVNAAIPDLTTINNLTAQLDSDLAAMGSKSYVLDAGGGVATSFKWGQWAAAFSAAVNLAGDMGVSAADGTPNITVVLPPSTPDVTTDAAIEGIMVQTTDIGLSLARSFELTDSFELAVGVTPKMQSRSVGTGSQGLDITDPTNIGGLNINYGSAEAGFNADAGVVARFMENIKFGIAARNLIASSFTVNTIEGPQTIDVQPQMRAGVAFNHRYFTVGLDMDLTENTTYLTNVKSKYMIVGTEINAWDLAQLRLGYRSNSLDANDVQYSFGAGLFNAINIGLMTNPNAPQAGVSGYVSFGLKF